MLFYDRSKTLKSFKTHNTIIQNRKPEKRILGKFSKTFKDPPKTPKSDVMNRYKTNMNK